jgi:hypothetical protein
MTAVTRVLPRYWDGSRLLRFLTGLAMLTLAFTAHLAPAPEPVAPPPAVAEASPSVSTSASRTVTVAEPAPVRPALAPATPALLGPVVRSRLVTGFALRVRLERAPPVA